jgi:drug/metabolite transporter (DMT)-like permease
MAIRATGAEPLPPPIVYVYLAVIVVTWAVNWPLMKLALTEAAPLQFVLVRLAGAIALLAPLLLAMRAPLLPVHGERLGLLLRLVHRRLRHARSEGSKVATG